MWAEDKQRRYHHISQSGERREQVTTICNKLTRKQTLELLCLTSSQLDKGCLPPAWLLSDRDGRITGAL